MSTMKAQIGASGESVIRQDLADGTFRIRMDEDNVPLCGYGNTRREAAKHLADQLREQARLVEAIEGSDLPRRRSPGQVRKARHA